MTGGVGVAPVPEGALIVFSVVDGVEGRQISLGPYDGFNVSGLAISRELGDVAATVPVGDGTDALDVLAGGLGAGSSPRPRRAVRAGRAEVSL